MPVQTPSQAAPLIRLRNVTLEYTHRSLLSGVKRHRVLNDINMDIAAGETVGIIGRNGAGKSSMLKLLAGVIDPNGGSVERGQHRVVLLSYQLGFSKLLTGRSNAIYSALLLGIGREEIEARMPEVIKFAGLEEAIDDQLVTYSAGMKARLGFAVAIQSDASVILVDEALGVGDHAFREKSMAFMKQWIQSNKTVVFVSHDESAVQGLCDRVVWLEGGHLVFQGPSQEVFDNYHLYDHIVSGFAKMLHLTEAEVRSHPNNRDPMAVISKVKNMVRDAWREEDVHSMRQGTGVRVYRPRRHTLLSHLIVEECGRSAWVENVNLMAEGDRDTVEAAYEKFNQLLEHWATSLKLDQKAFRNTRYYDDLLELLRSVATP
jgi:lipopolysaccharide transport system ATP-binding protein